MNTWLLMEALSDWLEPTLATMPLPVRSREGQGQPVPLDMDGSAKPSVRPARIHLGSMPPTAQDALSAAPFIVIQPLDGFDGEGWDYTRLVLRLCVVSDDLEEAENDLHNLISLVRLRIRSLPDGVLEKRFRLGDEGGGKVPWERPDEQALPFLQAHIFTIWETRGASYVPV